MNIKIGPQSGVNQNFHRSSPPVENDVSAEEPQAQQDLYDPGTNAATVGVLSLIGGAAGAVPGLGLLSYGVPANEYGAGKLTKAVAIGGFVANIVSTAVVCSGGPAWAMAVPGVLGAVAWGSYAYETRNHC